MSLWFNIVKHSLWIKRKNSHIISSNVIICEILDNWHTSSCICLISYLSFCPFMYSRTQNIKTHSETNKTGVIIEIAYPTIKLKYRQNISQLVRIKQFGGLNIEVVTKWCFTVYITHEQSIWKQNSNVYSVNVLSAVYIYSTA